LIKKIAIFGLLVLVGGIIGIAGGIGLSLYQSERARESLDTPKGRRFTSVRGALHLVGTMEMRVDCGCGPDEAGVQKQRQSLLRELESIDRIEKEPAPPPEIVSLLQVQTGMVHGRLAILEESAGNAQAYRHEMLAAQAALQAAGWQDFSEAVVRKLVEDSKNDTKTKPPGGQA
jgi:hypothetical protein